MGPATSATEIRTTLVLQLAMPSGGGIHDELIRIDVHLMNLRGRWGRVDPDRSWVMG